MRRGWKPTFENLPLTQSAVVFAETAHAGQLRSSDGAPFIEHPLEVGRLLYGVGAPDHVVASGVLHDVLEKTDTSPADLKARFGAAVAALVSAVSEDQTIRDYRRRKAALRQKVAAAGPEALTIFAADKVSKVRELRFVITRATAHRGRALASLVPARRLEHFRRCLGLLEETIGDSPLVGQLRLEVVGLSRDLRSLAAVAAA